MSPAEIVQLLRAHRLSASGEAALQTSIETILEAEGLAYKREARLSAGSRIDFLVDGGIGIEAKVKYPKRAIYRQLERYAHHDAIQALILVTGSAMGLPASIAGKPVFYVSIGRTSL